MPVPDGKNSGARGRGCAAPPGPAATSAGVLSSLRSHRTGSPAEVCQTLGQAGFASQSATFSLPLRFPTASGRLGQGNTIMSIAGHISRRMLKHCSHIRMEGKRRALDSLAGPVGPSRPAEQTTSNLRQENLPQILQRRCTDMGNGRVTLQSGGFELACFMQVIERNGRSVGTRTPDLYRVKVAL